MSVQHPKNLQTYDFLLSLRVQHNETGVSVPYIRGNASVSFNVNVQAQLFAGAVPRWVKGGGRLADSFDPSHKIEFTQTS